jgi:hypothetical protein
MLPIWKQPTARECKIRSVHTVGMRLETNRHRANRGALVLAAQPGRTPFAPKVARPANDHRIATIVPRLQPYGAAPVLLFRICALKAAFNGLQKESAP